MIRDESFQRQCCATPAATHVGRGAGSACWWTGSRRSELPEDEVVAQLIRVKGIGPWTAEMFLIFNLQRPDVWPTGDLGVRAGLGRVPGLDPPPTPDQMLLIAHGYRPWRSAVSWHCWRAMS